MRKLTLLLVLLAVSASAVGACGDDEEDSATTIPDVNPATETIEVSAVPDGSFAFEQDSLETEAGTITATFENPAAIAHDFCVEDSDGAELGCTDLIADGESDIAEFELEPGEYTYFCSVAGHREGGMEGTLTVE